MRCSDIREMPTCIDPIPINAKGAHESVLRAFHILEKTKEWLKKGVPDIVILELIADMEEKQGENDDY